MHRVNDEINLVQYPDGSTDLLSFGEIAGLLAGEPDDTHIDFWLRKPVKLAHGGTVRLIAEDVAGD